jgi:hypothetical protein
MIALGDYKAEICAPLRLQGCELTLKVILCPSAESVRRGDIKILKLTESMLLCSLA